uniref:ZSWIM1/3 RNaseH-like domain-containing protein n=1 Tax=Amphimedon queenslandica TaxID=400682 RepID=A0A1X7UP26_AMPQE
MLCEDSNGQSEIVAVCILVTENAKGIRWMFETFEAQNAKWCDVKAVMSDKDINEREMQKTTTVSNAVTNQCHTPAKDDTNVKSKADVKMLPVTKMRGWPKGHKLTTVGLLCRKGKAALKPTSFIDLHFYNKRNVMLRWLVDNGILASAMTSDELIEEDQVDSKPEKVPCSTLDEAVEILMINLFSQKKHGLS